MRHYSHGSVGPSNVQNRTKWRLNESPQLLMTQHAGLLQKRPTFSCQSAGAFDRPPSYSGGPQKLHVTVLCRLVISVAVVVANGNEKRKTQPARFVINVEGHGDTIINSTFPARNMTKDCTEKYRNLCSWCLYVIEYVDKVRTWM